MGLRGVICLGVFLLLAACGKGAGDTQASLGLPTFDVPKLDSEREEFLHSFPLLNDSEEEAAPRDPRTGKSPFGALIRMATFGQGSFCSISHVTAGKVVTNAHCVPSGSKPEEYFVVFYNKRNVKRYERVIRFVYVGSQESNDIAVLQLAPDVARNWDTVSGRTVDTRSEIGRSTPALHKVIVWAFNPFEGNHPELFEKYKGPGMRFTPKHCNASRTIPKVLGIQTNEAGDEMGRVRVNSKGSSEKMHWFMDDCDKRPVHGNSGSLITLAENTEALVGTFHWVFPADPEKMAQYTNFEYTANDGGVSQLSWEDMKVRDFFGVGTDFVYQLGQTPGIF